MIVKLVLAILGMALLAAVTTGVIAAASTRNETVACLDDATKVLQRIAADPPNGIPEEVTAAAKCVAVVPRLLKGRFRLTAPRGKGVVTCRNLEGWSAPAFFTFSDGLWLPPVWGHGYEPHRGGHGSKRPTTALNQKDRDPELMCRQSAGRLAGMWHQKTTRD